MVSLFLDYPLLAALLIYAAIAGGMLAFLEWGRRSGRSHMEIAQQPGRAGVGAVEGSLYALFGLLLAFTFSGAADRFSARRFVALEEVKAVAAVWKRLDHLPEPGRSKLRDLVRRHATENSRAHKEKRSLEGFKEDIARVALLEDEIWTETLKALAQPGTPSVIMPVTGSMQTMFEKRMARAEALDRHPPILIYGMLLILGWVCAYLTGFGMAEAKVQSWTHVAAYVGIISLTMYIIFDLEFPSMGLIRVEDTALQALIQSLK